MLVFALTNSPFCGAIRQCALTFGYGHDLIVVRFPTILFEICVRPTVCHTSLQKRTSLGYGVASALGNSIACVGCVQALYAAAAVCMIIVSFTLNLMSAPGGRFGKSFQKLGKCNSIPKVFQRDPSPLYVAIRIDILLYVSCASLRIFVVFCI